MENKVLVELLVPELEESFDVYLPITKRVGNIIALLVKSINDMGIDYELTSSIALYSRVTSKRYDPNDLIYDTDIRNGSILILM